jgi:subtilisin
MQAKNSSMLRAICFTALLFVGISAGWGQPIPGRYLAVFEDHVADPGAAAQAVAAQHGLAVSYVYRHALKGFAFAGSAQAAQALSRRPGVAYVESDQIYRAGTQEQPTGIRRADVDVVWLGDDTTGELLINNQPAPWLNVDIAIIDTGVGPHSDLNVVGGVRFYTKGLFLRSDNRYADDNGHGTHVAGTAAAVDDRFGVVGVAPGARVWAVKVLNQSGSGSLSAVIAGVDWVTARADDIEVANLSLGGGFSQAMNDAVWRGTQKGVVFAVAAGNSNADASNFSPASEATAITVSALADSDGLPGGAGAATRYGADDTLATFSNWGAAVDLAAPGVDILSTLPNDTYGVYSGTSMAAPHVAGGAALYISVNGYEKSWTGVAAVTAALLNAGWKPTEAGYFTGDRDSFPEPLLNVGRLIGSREIADLPPEPEPEPEPEPVIQLSANGYKIRSRQMVDLSWSGGTAAYSISRNGQTIATGVTGTSHTDDIGAKGGGSYLYLVIDANGAQSNTVTVTF